MRSVLRSRSYICLTLWRRWLDAFFLATTFFGQRLVLRFTSTCRHVKGDGSFPGRTKSMSCRRAARRAARNPWSECSEDSSEDSSEGSSESMVGVQLGGQLGGRLGGCCPRFSSEGSNRAPPSTGCAGVFEWNTHSRPARIATIPSRCFAIQASRRGASLFTCR